MTTQVETTTKVTLPANATVGDLADVLADLPRSARLSFQHHAGTDQRDPSFTSLSIRWDDTTRPSR